MNNKFDYVINCTLNNSASKQAHRFSTANRFPAASKPNCLQASYDLSKTMMTSRISSKDNVLPRTQRFRTAGSVSPSPDAYLHRSFIEENKRLAKGNRLGRAERSTRINTAPGPGTYQANFNPQAKLMYTMRGKKQARDYGSRLGPGQYEISKYNRVDGRKTLTGKYNNITTTTVNQAVRFKPKEHNTIGPGPGMHGPTVQQMGKDPKFCLTFSEKKPSYIGKSWTPGPGSQQLQIESATVSVSSVQCEVV